MAVNGRVIPHTPLAVDFWQVRKCPQARLFFLSHMHSDHTVGLTSTWSDRPIYCSPVSANLLSLKLQVKEKWIHPLEVGDTYLLPLDDIGKEKVTVTLIDANHCPGAVMFLFEGYFGSILYTGDFRYTPSILREPCLRMNTTIDVLYLDNTLCDPNRSLPSRQQASQQIKEIIRCHPDHDVVIGLYSLGKESLLVELAMEFQTWIEVTFERMKTIKALDLPDVFTTDLDAGRIRVVDSTEICSSSLHQWNSKQPTLAILPTSKPLVSFHPKLHVVPYSDHSSYHELVDFVEALGPTSLLPIVGHCLPASLLDLLPRRKRHEILVPESVQHYMLKDPGSQVRSSAFTINHRPHVRPQAPRGVVFESPVRPLSRVAECLQQEDSEEEMDTGNSGNKYDPILSDLSPKFTPNKNQKRHIDPWSLNVVETVPDEVAMAESVSFSQFTQSNFAPMETVTNAKVCLIPTRTTPVPSEPWTRRTYRTPSNENSSRCPDGVSESITPGVGEDADIMAAPTQHSAHDASENRVILPQMSPDNKSSSSSSDSSEMSHVFVEEIENNILKELTFAAEDLEPCSLLGKSSIWRFSICPMN